MPLTVTPFDAPLGAEITEIDLREPLSGAEFQRIKQAWHKYQVLIIRNQYLSKNDQLKFASGFGTVGARGRPPEKRNETDDYDGAIMLITNKRDDDGKFIGSVPEGELWFHSDLSYQPVPHKATFLHAIELPTSGGNTLFANMYQAYENISSDLKLKLAGHEVLHAYDFATTAGVDIDRDLNEIQHCWQPIFVTHPITGRPALYVSRLMSARIEGLARTDSNPILEDLFDIAEDPAIIYEHVWKPRDLVIIDNRCCLHARRDFPPGELRMLQRCTVRCEERLAATAA